MQLGALKRYQTEDYIMVVVLGFYTTLVSVMNIVAHLDTNLMMPGDIPNLTPASIKSRMHGSKLVLVVEQSMIMTIWGCKFCLLLMYNKLTFGLKQQLAVKIVACYVLTGLVVMEILYFGVWCRPFHEYWAVPTDNVQCSAAIHHLITNAVFNISSDIMMLSIPLPLLITSQLPKAKKLILCCLFGLGVFVILCAVLNKYYSFAHPFSPMWTYWYIREASTAILVANMPMCWSLMRRLFNLRSFNGGTSGTRSKNTHTTPRTGTTGIGSKMHGMKSLTSNSGGSRAERGEISWWEREGVRSESEEYIVLEPTKAAMPLEIWESKEFDVVKDERNSQFMDSKITQPDKMYDGPKGFETKTVVTARSSDSEGSSRS